jgi:hypothetical protein
VIDREHVLAPEALLVMTVIVVTVRVVRWSVVLCGLSHGFL